ncbi:hypothetical protein F8M41_025548 [Gigaspora margarita]|uniref:Uncharacterized protein n=1 Tax=Gigaspora margarita TaxID=4874 RepID=A0A8H3XIH0_GIGMA|nr:hypothetical protein F8M41_025548 [Gigaspora margarita]
MSISNEATNVKDKDCSGCGKSKPISEFTRQCGDQVITGSTCNQCSERQKQNRLNRLDKKLNVEKQVESLNNILVETENHESSDNLLYEICDIEELIAFNFKNSKEKDGKVKFSIVVNIENELVNEEALSSELDFEERLSPELDYEDMLLPELDHEDMLPSELDQDEMLSLELDKSDEKKFVIL